MAFGAVGLVGQEPMGSKGVEVGTNDCLKVGSWAKISPGFQTVLQSVVM